MSALRPLAAPIGVCLLAAATAAAQTPGYTWTPTCASVSSSLTPRTINFPTHDSVQAVPIGFDFPFFGQTYTTAYLSSNGWLSFDNPGPASAPASAPIPTPAAPNNLIAFYWNDLQPQAGGTRSGNTGTGSLWIEMRATERLGGLPVDVDIELHPSGNIRMFWNQVGQTAAVEVGLEDATASAGLRLWGRGPVPGGVALQAGTAIEIVPPPRLGGAAPGACDSSATFVAGAANLLHAYPWTPGTFDAWEQAVSVAPGAISELRAAISGYFPRNLSLWILAGDPGADTSPLAGPSTSLVLPVAPPGAYSLLVDGPRDTDLGPSTGGFALDVACTPLPALDCGASVAGVTSGPDRTSRWSCAAQNEAGPEAYYTVTVLDGGTLDLDLSSAVNHDLVVLDPDQFALGCSGCRAFGDTTAEVALLAPGTTLVVGVEGRTATDSGAFQLSARCSKNLDCAAASPIDLARPRQIQGTTVGGPSAGDTYTCATSLTGQAGPYAVTGLTGPERVYSFTVPDGQTVAFHFRSANPDLVPLILDACNEGRCRTPASCAEALPAGTYLLVVDGRNGAAGDFTLTPIVLPALPYNRWYDCPECCDAQCLQFLDPESWIERTNWRFSSGNNCGTACDFALFAVVDCGRGLHVPIFDAESFRVRAYDILRGRYAILTATNDLPLNPPGVERRTLTGIEVAWDDRGCSPLPPCPSGNCGGSPSCGGGTDPVTDGAIWDISLADPESACGVYLLEFVSMGGSVWDAYANCTGDRTETYPLFRDLCSAMESWDPHPELAIEDLRVDSTQCPDPVVSFRVRNLGCAPAVAFQVRLSSDGGEPDVLVPVDYLRPLDEASFSVSFPVTGSSRTLTATADGVPASGVIAECAEVASYRGCGGLSGAPHEASRLACAPCSVSAVAGANQTICATDEAPLDGSGSLLDTCPTSLLYRWEEIGNPGNFRDFDPDPRWTGQRPASSTDYRLIVQCQGNPTCTAQDDVSVFVNPQLQPGRIGNTLLGARRGNDTEWRWSAPGSGNPPHAYRVWRDTTRDVAVPTRTLAATVLAPLTIAVETGGVSVPGSPQYHQAVATSCGQQPLEGPY